jgi:hypothetical protein
MSQTTITRDYSFTVRLSQDEKRLLETLSKRLKLDKSATLREVLRFASADANALPASGRFVSLPSDSLVFPIRLNGKVVDAT